MLAWLNVSYKGQGAVMRCWSLAPNAIFFLFKLRWPPRRVAKFERARWHIRYNSNEVMNEVIQTKFQLIQFMWTPSQVGTTTRKVFHTWIAILTSYDAETRRTKVNIGLVLNFHQSLAPDSSSYVPFASFTFKCFFLYFFLASTLLLHSVTHMTLNTDVGRTTSRFWQWDDPRSLTAVFLKGEFRPFNPPLLFGSSSRNPPRQNPALLLSPVL